MASLPLPAITRYLENPGEPEIDFTEFYRQFQNLLCMVNATRSDAQQLTASQKNRYLLLHLGREGNRIWNTNPMADQVDTLGHEAFAKEVQEQFRRRVSDSRPLTTTITHQGLFQYTRLPMGLKESAATMQRLVDQTLADCKGCERCDDILVYGRNQAEHDSNLREVLKRLSSKDFRLAKLEKLEISKPEISALGYRI
ncbi:MAG: RNA-directed DNA polymerase, partial [Gammaproteobacteria bacterium]|nr:RNA-directed DNA polymerase [Gammaproteobacteria bacterium]